MNRETRRQEQLRTGGTNVMPENPVNPREIAQRDAGLQARLEKAKAKRQGQQS